MPLPLLASPYKGEETEWRPHKSLKSQKTIDKRACPWIACLCAMREFRVQSSEFMVQRDGGT
jgi:hypothetical protein